MTKFYLLDGEEEKTDTPSEEGTATPEEEATSETAQTKTCAC